MFLFTMFLMDGPAPQPDKVNGTEAGTGERGHDNSAFALEDARAIRLSETSRL